MLIPLQKSWGIRRSLQKQILQRQHRFHQARTINASIQTISGQQGKAKSFAGFSGFSKSPELAPQGFCLFFSQGDFAVVEFYLKNIDDIVGTIKE